MMEGWKQVKLAEYYKIHSGLSKSAEEFGFGYPFLSFSDIFWNYFAPNELTQLVNSSEKEQLSCSVKKGDVFLTRTSETVEELGMSCVALKDYPKATFNGFAKRLRPKNDKDLEPKFIGFYLRSPQFRAEITAYSTLTTRASLNNGIIGRLRINLPPLPTQRKIAQILSAYDDLIENNLKRIKLLEEMAQKTYEEWFIRFKFPKHENAVFDKESGLPEGWKKKSITNFSSFKQDKSKLKPFINTKIYFATADVDETKITSKGEIITWKNKPSRAQIKPNRNTVWFARMSNTYKVLCFNNKNIELQNNSVLSSGFAGFKATNDLCLPFLYFTINSSFFHEMKNIYATGATQVSLNNESMRFMITPEPTIEIIEKYGIKTLPLIEEISVLVNQNQHLKEARDILLPRLMTGTIDVEKIELKL